MVSNPKHTTLHKLPLEFYRRNTLAVAEDLMGCFLVHDTPEGRIVGRINEGEAYLGVHDKASHASRGRLTQRTSPLYEAGGIAYIHLIYGIYHCFNAVTQKEGVPQSVLMRGVEIVEGFDLAAQNRYGLPYKTLTTAQLKNFTNGPGKLCMAMAIDNSLNRISMRSDKLYICDAIGTHYKSPQEIKRSKRIGVDYAEEAKDFLYRFTAEPRP